ncbi:MAG: Ig-like domain-containing protein [Eubacterium sp.]|nr:Ig-like domain-containing protein [Eubacterium sp.]
MEYGYDPRTLKLNKGKRLRVKNAPGKVRWKSDKKSVATVTNKGFVKAVGHGKAVIKAYGTLYIC